jgi:DNA-binding transcriptional LysR family regulator
MSALDVDAVQAFVTIANLQSFTRAAEALGTTQGAISVKLKRLEDRLGHKLIERTPRMVRLSAQGALFVDSARDFLAAHDRAVAALSATRRRFALGIAAHVAGPEVPTLLARLNAHDPTLTIEVRLDNSRNLLDAFDRGEIDAAIVRREDDRRDGEVLAPEHFGWFAAPGFVHRPGEALRLAALTPAVWRARRCHSCAGRGWHRMERRCFSVAALQSYRTLSRRALPPRSSPAGLHRPAPSKSARSLACHRWRRRKSYFSRHCRICSLAKRCEPSRLRSANTARIRAR